MHVLNCSPFTKIMCTQHLSAVFNVQILRPYLKQLTSKTHRGDDTLVVFLCDLGLLILPQYHKRFRMLSTKQKYLLHFCSNNPISRPPALYLLRSSGYWRDLWFMYKAKLQLLKRRDLQNNNASLHALPATFVCSYGCKWRAQKRWTSTFGRLRDVFLLTSVLIFDWSLSESPRLSNAAFQYSHTIAWVF